MADEKVHGTRSPDGTKIGGRVQGEGPPIVFVHGGLGDDDSWRFIVPFLERRFTCYAMSTRGRGLSSDKPDHSWERLVEDVQAFVESIDEPVGLVGHSSGGALALEATARTDAVSSLALFEPTVFELGADMRAAARDEQGFARIRELAEQGRLADAAQVFLEDIALANDAEMEAVAAAGGYDIMAPNVPPALEEVAQSGPPHLSDPTLPERMTVMALILRGTATHPFYTTVAQRVAERLPTVEVRDLEGVGHLGPIVAPELVAGEFGSFFTDTLAPT